MSIRLRLTLLYTTILALTLIGFGAILYGSQSQSLLAQEKQMLAGVARGVVNRRLRTEHQAANIESRWPPGDEKGPNPRFDLPAYTQLLSLERKVIDRSENLEGVVLPLSDAGWQAVQSGESWVETASVEDERLLIHTAPVIVEDQIAQVVQVARSLASQDQYLSTLGRNLLIGSGLATIAAFGIGWILSGAVLRPIHRITQTAQAIGAERNFDRRVQHTGPNDEIGQLAITFNAMLTELQSAYQQQQQFVADVSHELRTPLTTVRGNLALLRRQPPISAEDKTDILDDMVGESDRLIRLVNDLLTLARAEAGRLLQSEPVRVKPLVEDVCHQARLLDPDRTITCAPLHDVAVVGDQDALKQVLLVLMDNALKHTIGTITVTTTNMDGPETGFSGKDLVSYVMISIRDTGPGIDPEVLPHVFERFYRGAGAWARPGIGLGLPIAKALVEAQNGAITVESQVGQGSVFTVALPRASVHRGDSDAAQR
ncbi:MAG: HAMP domain-containing sensor histidine kinase [Chloroflexota bacterium]|nr:HAMP domain-containing sensor histidine kinase [Chloroflexota bacterium]